jgi:hypothetical protein
MESKGVVMPSRFIYAFPFSKFNPSRDLSFWKFFIYFFLKKIVMLSNIIKPCVKKFHVSIFFVKIVKGGYEMQKGANVGG